MAGIYRRIVGENQQLGCNTVDKLAVIASFEVGTAYRSPKQYIAGKQHFIGGIVKYEMPRAMSRNVYTLEGGGAKADHIAFVQIMTYRHGILHNRETVNIGAGYHFVE